MKHLFIFNKKEYIIFYKIENIHKKIYFIKIIT